MYRFKEGPYMDHRISERSEAKEEEEQADSCAESIGGHVRFKQRQIHALKWRSYCCCLFFKRRRARAEAGTSGASLIVELLLLLLLLQAEANASGASLAMELLLLLLLQGKGGSEQSCSCPILLSSIRYGPVQGLRPYFQTLVHTIIV